MGKDRRPMEETCGPIIGYSLDGDIRRRQLMLKDYSSTIGIRYQIPWEWCRLIGMYDGFKVIGLHDQDYIHIDNKLVNILFSGRWDLIIGKEVVNFNNNKIVYNTFKVDDQNIKIEDIERIVLKLGNFFGLYQINPKVTSNQL